MELNLFSGTDSVQPGIPLSRFTEAISNVVARASLLAGVWVTAELSDVRVAGGHCYMELIEKNEAGQTIAKLRANIWRNTFIQLRQKFYNATQKDITTGIKVLVRGSATHHSIYGLSFNIIDIDPSYTVGDLERLRREIFLRLQKEGIVYNNKQLPLPPAPQKIAVISAEGAAGYGDFMNHLTGNSEGFVFYPCLFPCIMQGDKVSESIRKALTQIEMAADFWDCVAIVRGGGATTDLNGFDDYELAKVVATCSLPVIVGIGHERDRNILDEIAHTSVKTPTAVAGFFIDRVRSAYDRVLNIADKLRVYSSDLMRGEERKLSSLHTLVPQLALRRLEDAKAKINTISGKLPLLTSGRIGKEQIRIESYIKLLGSQSDNRISRAGQKINNLESLVKVLDPINTLKRGYSVTRIGGKSVKSIKEIKEGDTIITSFADGQINSVVK